MGKAKQPRIRLLADRVAVKPAKAEEMSKGGIIIPESAQENKPTQGIIVSVSQMIPDEGKPHEQVEVGQTALYSQYAGSDIELDGETYKILRITDVIAIIEDK